MVLPVEFRGSKRPAKRMASCDHFLQTWELFYLHGLSLFRKLAVDSICRSFCARNTGNAVAVELVGFRALRAVEKILLSTDELAAVFRSISSAGQMAPQM